MKILFYLFFVLSLFCVTIHSLDLTSCIELQNMIADDPSVFYNVTTDIDCIGITTFATVGSQTNIFMGKILGNNFTIKNLKTSGNNFLAIIAQGKDCSVSDLNLRNITVSSTNAKYGGALFSYCSNCTLNNLNLSGSSVSITGATLISVGGLIGYSTNIGKISNSNVYQSIFSSNVRIG